MNFGERIAICHGCDRRERGCAGACACTLDGRDIIEHAETRNCPIGAYVDLSRDTPVEEVWGLIGRRPIARSNGWQNWPNVRAAHRLAMAEFRATTSALPPCDGRGVVIVGGGKYFPSAYVTLRMLRHVGCTLPVEMWYFGDRHELLDWQAEALRELSITPVDADAVVRKHPQRILDGWQLKPFAVLYSRFAEILYLDADSYPVRNPEGVFSLGEYRTTGALFWPDPPQLHLVPEVWEAVGLEYREERTFESGQFVIDKRRAPDATWLCHWMNQHSDYYYRLGPRHPIEFEGKRGQGIYGDKDTWHLAWRLCGREYAMPEKDYEWVPPAMIQFGFDDEPQFVHRARRKFILGRAVNFGTSPQEGPYVESKLPMEAEAHGFLAELQTRSDAHTDHAARFGEVYQADVWGGSGHGSREDTTRQYRQLLQTLLNRPDIKSVLDIGCGDWQIGRLMDWNGVRYTGVDVVPSLIDKNRRDFRKDGIEFLCADLSTGDLPAADLVIIKDVLQHWPTAAVQEFLKNLDGRLALITNSAKHGSAATNVDIPVGEYRPLDLLAAPFSLEAHEVLRYQGSPGDFKSVLLLHPRGDLLEFVSEGMKGITKAITGSGGATPETIEQRTKICVGCDQAELRGGALSQCRICKCSTWAKVRNASAACPLGKWQPQMQR